MGELTTNLANVAAYQNQIYPNGIDLGRSIYQQDIGILEADPNAVFRAGMLVTRNVTNGLIYQSTGQDMFGVAKWNKTTQLYAVQNDEPQVLTGTTATNLNYANVSNVRVASAPNATLGSQDYALTTDYTVNTTNGTITRAGGSTIPTGATVYVTYTWAVQQSNLVFQGQNFWNTTDDVTIQDGRITIITDWSIIFTTQYDTSQLYTLTGLTSNLYAAGVSTSTNGGLFTSSTSDGGIFVGRVFQVPSAGDPYLGVTFSANPVQAQSGTITAGSSQVTA
jgi:hypothetical protein